MILGNSKVDEDKIPTVWKLFIFTGFIYAIYGVYSYIAYPDERLITHLPAWFRRLFDGILVLLFGGITIKYPSKYPWKGWFQHSWILWYALLSLVIHYGGMVPPIYIYDLVPIFNKILHANASLIIFLLLRVGRKDSSKYFWVDMLITSSIGLIWELMEFLTIPDNIDYWTVNSIAYGWADTKGDMLANIIGILIGIIYVKFNKTQSPNLGNNSLE